MSKSESKLTQLLIDAGIGRSQARKICAACDNCGLPKGASDGIASALFTWRRKFGNQRLAYAREKARQVLKHFPMEREEVIEKLSAIQVDFDPQQLTLEELMHELMLNSPPE